MGRGIADMRIGELRGLKYVAAIGVGLLALAALGVITFNLGLSRRFTSDLPIPSGEQILRLTGIETAESMVIPTIEKGPVRFSKGDAEFLEVLEAVRNAKPVVTSAPPPLVGSVEWESGERRHSMRYSKDGQALVDFYLPPYLNGGKVTPSLRRRVETVVVLIPLTAEADRVFQLFFR